MRPRGTELLRISLHESMFVRLWERETCSPEQCGRGKVVTPRQPGVHCHRFHSIRRYQKRYTPTHRLDVSAGWIRCAPVQSHSPGSNPYTHSLRRKLPDVSVFLFSSWHPPTSVVCCYLQSN